MRIFEALMRATTYMDHRRIPELYCGFRRRPGRGPTLYPAACSPQAWAAGAPVLAAAGDAGSRVRPRGAQGRARQSVRACVGRADHVRNVTLGDASADFAVCQDGGVARAGAAHHGRCADLSLIRCPRQDQAASLSAGFGRYWMAPRRRAACICFKVTCISFSRSSSDWAIVPCAIMRCSRPSAP